MKHQYLWERARDLERIEKDSRGQRAELNKDIEAALQEEGLILYRTESVNVNVTNVYWWFKDVTRDKSSKQYRAESAALLAFENKDVDWQ